MLYHGGGAATCQFLGMPAEQERHAYAVPFFPLGSVFLPSEESVFRLDEWPLSRKYCLGFGIELRFDTDLGDEFSNSHKFIYSHHEVSNSDSTFGYVRPLSLPPQVPGIGSCLLSSSSGSTFKTELLPYNNAYCSWLFQATLGHLSFGTHLLLRLKGAMQISVIGHPLGVPFQALQGYFITRVAGSFRFQTARGPWPGATA